MRTLAKKPQSTHGRNSGNTIKKNKAPFVQSHKLNPILHLQQTVGNQAVQIILRSGSQEMSRGYRLITHELVHTIQQRTGRPALQLEEARQAAAVPVVYTQALHQLQSINATLHRYLQAAGWNTYQQILRVSGGGRNIIFRLRISQGALPPRLFARFVRERVNYSDPTNPIFPMTITLSIPSFPT